VAVAVAVTPTMAPLVVLAAVVLVATQPMVQVQPALQILAVVVVAELVERFLVGMAPLVVLEL